MGRNDPDSTNRHFGKFLMYFHVYSHTLYRQILCKFRISAHNLRIETGRYEKTKDNSGNYSKLEKENRICKFCNLRMVEDESHFLLKCPLYIVRDSSAVRRLLWTCCSVGRLRELYIRKTADLSLQLLVGTFSRFVAYRFYFLSETLI